MDLTFRANDHPELAHAAAIRAVTHFHQLNSGAAAQNAIRAKIELSEQEQHEEEKTASHFSSASSSHTGPSFSSFPTITCITSSSSSSTHQVESQDDDDDDAFWREEERKMMKNPPSEIVPNLLYLGSLTDAFNMFCLEKLNVKTIINCTREVPNYYPKRFTYHKFSLDDDECVTISTHFERVHEIIDEAKRQKHAVLVHCAAGVSRSATMVISYIMKTMGLSLHDSYLYVRARRPVIGPNDGFIKQLRAFEQQISIQSSPSSSSPSSSSDCRSCEPSAILPETDTESTDGGDSPESETRHVREAPSLSSSLCSSPDEGCT